MKSDSKSIEKFLQTIKIVSYYGLKSIGLAPFSIINKNQIRSSIEENLNKKKLRNRNNGIKLFSPSKFGTLYNIALLILIVQRGGRELYEFHYLNESDKFSAGIMMEKITRTSELLTPSIVLIYYAFGQKNFTDILNKFYEIINFLLNYNNDNDKNDSFKISNKDKSVLKLIFGFYTNAHLIFNIFMWSSFWIFQSIKYNRIINNNNGIIGDKSLFNFLSAHLPIAVTFWFIVEYFTAVKSMTVAIKMLNNNLSNLMITDFETHFTINDDRLSRSQLFNSYYYLAAFGSPSSSSSSSSSSIMQNRHQLIVLKLFRNIRTTLSNLSIQIGDFFSFPILICVGYSFLYLILDFYHIVICCVNYESAIDNNCDYLWIAINVVWIFVCMYPLVILCLNVTKFEIEAKNTVKTIHKLLHESKTREIKKELKQFSLQLLHENFNFTGYGFFSLDTTLLHTIFAATATYLIILMQFQYANNNSSK